MLATSKVKMSGSEKRKGTQAAIFFVRTYDISSVKRGT